MKIKHAVILEEDEIDMLFDMVKDVCLMTYPTVDAQTAALESAKIDFETQLNRYMQKAFKYGKKIQKSKADTKDTEMYKPKM